MRNSLQAGTTYPMCHYQKMVSRVWSRSSYSKETYCLRSRNHPRPRYQNSCHPRSNQICLPVLWQQLFRTSSSPPHSFHIWENSQEWSKCVEGILQGTSSLSMSLLLHNKKTTKFIMCLTNLRNLFRPLPLMILLLLQPQLQISSIFQRTADTAALISPSNPSCKLHTRRTLAWRIWSWGYCIKSYCWHPNISRSSS